MAESTDRLDAQAGRGGPTEKEETFVDEGFEVSEAPASNDADAAASKGSKKFVDEDSKSPEYRSDEWRMKNFKVRCQQIFQRVQLRTRKPGQYMTHITR